MKEIHRWLYYRYLRYTIKHRKWIEEQNKARLNTTQILSIDIFKNAIYDKDAILLVDRRMEISYIHIPSKKLFLKLERKELTISNSVYDRFIQLPEYEYIKLINEFDRKLTQVRHKWEATILEKSTDNLKKLLTDLKK